MPIGRRGTWIRATLLVAAAITLSWFSLRYMTSMPGESHAADGKRTFETSAILESRLREHVTSLAGGIGIRHDDRPRALERAVDYIDAQMQPLGSVRRSSFEYDGQRFVNLDVTRPGTSHRDEILVIGAHYDTARETPGANDNASGVAAMLELAGHELRERSTARTLRFVAFANEEPPHFKKKHMGSLVYARRCREQSENIVAMISLETLGYYSDEPGSQRYPWPLASYYPSTGNFVAFIGNLGSRALVRRTIDSFRSRSDFPSEGGAFPSLLPGVGWSDHWSFWKAGYPAVMVTDTAPFRYPHYHTPEDTPSKLDYRSLARIVDGLSRVLHDLATDVR